MYSKLTPYASPPPLRSSLLKSPSDAVPPTDDLKGLESELKILRQKLIERSKKASDDMRTIEESMRRMKEIEKGKAKSIEKVKRERDFTPLPDADEPRLSSSISGKPRLSSHPLQAGPSSSRSSLDPRSAFDESKKKKKRKREYDESDLESSSQRPRKGTPPVVNHPPPPPPPPKAQKSVPLAPSKPQTGPDFSVPQANSLLPQRPPIPPPPIPGPSKPTDVTDDFSKLKQPPQTLTTTFYTYIEPWIRNIREEDVGFLEHTGDEVEPYVMPKLGRHYTSVWEEQDMGLFPPADQDAPPEVFQPPVPKWDPSTLLETECLVEEKGHGLLTERVISALLPMENNEWKGVKAAEDAMEGRPGGSGAAAARKEKLSVSDLETRIRDTMRYHGLLNEIPDYTEKVDDPISTALRHAQRELRRVVATNKARKARLVDIARDRLGYQEYVELRESIDKNISNTYSKLQGKDMPKLGKKKKKSIDETNTMALPPCPAALGLGPDERNHLVVTKQLKQLVGTRRQWVDTVGKVFEKKQEESPGRIWGVPKTSIYEGVEEEVQAALANMPTGITRTSNIKGKGKARDAMDVG
ncbi:hypothetical protein ARMSODRAFT_962122 [Armillaria solidipes]|uniref:Uncharacterized protein n=1 Tax=Armillaria solidipes TaxID=1076256 RepID=A0A2H3B0Y5_9AGAR|nr:hypothetical protein ARMSODRAFT_962122 [Armillaria solidipes]